MKKTILGLSFLMMAAFAGSVSAQCTKENCADKEICKKERCDRKDCDKKDCDRKDCDKKDCDRKDCDKKDCDRKDCKTECVKDRTACPEQNCRDSRSPKAGKGPYCRIPAPRAEGEACHQEGCSLKDKIYADLNLSDAQKEKIEDLDKAMQTSRKEAFAEMRKAEKSLSREEIAEKEKALKAKYLEDMKKILSGDQYSKFLENFFIHQNSHQPQMKLQGRMAKKAEKGEVMRTEHEKTVVEKKKSKK